MKERPSSYYSAAYIDGFAKILHEAGREAVEKGATVAAENFGEPTRKFLSWDEISEQAREGRRIQARYILDRFMIWDRPQEETELGAR